VDEQLLAGREWNDAFEKFERLGESGRATVAVGVGRDEVSFAGFDETKREFLDGVSVIAAEAVGVDLEHGVVFDPVVEEAGVLECTGVTFWVGEDDAQAALVKLLDDAACGQGVIEREFDQDEGVVIAEGERDAGVELFDEVGDDMDFAAGVDEQGDSALDQGLIEFIDEPKDG